MPENEQDIFARSFAILTALRNNISQMEHRALETYVQEFHSVLDKLTEIGFDVADFRIPGSEVKPRITATHMGGGRSYSDEKYVDKPLILTKLDAIIGYFNIITSEKPKKIGFSKPNNE